MGWGIQRRTTDGHGHLHLRDMVDGGGIEVVYGSADSDSKKELQKIARVGINSANA